MMLYKRVDFNEIKARRPSTTGKIFCLPILVKKKPFETMKAFFEKKTFFIILSNSIFETFLIFAKKPQI